RGGFLRNILRHRELQGFSTERSPIVGNSVEDDLLVGKNVPCHDQAVVKVKKLAVALVFLQGGRPSRIALKLLDRISLAVRFSSAHSISPGCRKLALHPFSCAG